MRSKWGRIALGIALGSLALWAWPQISEKPARADGFNKFVDRLPIPKVIQVRSDAGIVDLEIPITAVKTRLHQDLPEGQAWGYAGSSPGPTIEVQKGTRLRVHWKNQLTGVPPLKAAMGDMGSSMLPDLRVVTHLHGAAIEQASISDRLHNNDGWPDAWITPGMEQIAEYPNLESARLLWYHDHAMGVTGRNVAAGLFGAYLVRDENERAMNLPSGEFEVPLILQAHGVNPDGSQYYSDSLSQEFYGNSVAINGKLWPFLEVEPRKYRFRVVNASNARSYAMKLIDFSDQSAGPALFQIGTDGGFLTDTLTLNDPSDVQSPRLSLAPGERADVIVDFSSSAGKSFVLQNNSLEPGDGELPIPYLMLFKVKASISSPDVSTLPMHPGSNPVIAESSATVTRKITFTQKTMGSMTMMYLNGKSWNDPIEEKPRVGSTEIWELVNTTTSMHPFHMHLVNFQVLDNQDIDLAAYGSSGHVVPQGDRYDLDANQLGWKDVVQVQPGTITRVIATFGPFKGFYVYHCHILEHEDMDMMRPFQVE